MQLSDIQTVACLGTGTMGHGIAFLAAKAGYAVRLYGRTPESITRGMEGIDRAITVYEDNDLMPKGEGEIVKSRITGVTSLEEAADGVDFVTESIAENVQIKQEAYAILERHCRPDAVISTNTSGLSLSVLSEKLARPELFISVHFFAPPYLMTPVEVTPGPATSQETRAIGEQWVTSIGCTPIILEKEIQGFIANRIQAACLREALYIVEQGWASAETVDKAITLSLGRRYSTTGPLESADMGGLDIFNSVLTQLPPVLNSRTEPDPLLTRMVQQGRLGLKNGKGLYDWPPEAIQARRDAREQSLIGFLRKPPPLRD